MSFPIPSFAKIRLVALIIGFVVVCFVVGAVRNAFSATFQCPPVQANAFTCLIMDGQPMSNRGLLPVLSGSFKWIDTSTGYASSNSPSAECASGYKTNYVGGMLYACDPDEPCREERAQKLQECGSALNMEFNNQTCKGSCICPLSALPDCSEKGGLLAIYRDTCAGVCDDCSEEQIQAFITCGDLGVSWFDNETCTYECDNCDARYALCMSKCAGDIQYYQCEPGEDGGAIISQCICVDDKNPPALPQEPKVPSDEPDPEIEPTPDPDPNSPDEDHPEVPWLTKIKGDTGKLVELSNKINGKLRNIDENIARSVSNQGVLDKSIRATQGSVEAGTKAIVSALGDLDVSGDNKGVESRLDAIGEKLEELKPGNDFGEITASDFDEAYSLDEEFDISDRFGTFVDTIKTTGLFSVPGQFFNSLPSGGSSAIHIDAGQYGDHSVDLNETLGPGLVVLRSLFVIIFGFFSIRAVVMKR